jgi:hypothetical protein
MRVVRFMFVTILLLAGLASAGSGDEQVFDWQVCESRKPAASSSSESGEVFGGPLEGVFYVLTHYQYAMQDGEAPKQWEECVWRISREGQDLKWQIYSFSGFNTDPSRFRKDSRTGDVRSVPGWKPSEAQLESLRDHGARVSKRGSSSYDLRSVGEERWKKVGAMPESAWHRWIWRETTGNLGMAAEYLRRPWRAAWHPVWGGYGATLPNRIVYCTTEWDPRQQVWRGDYFAPEARGGKFLAYLVPGIVAEDD